MAAKVFINYSHADNAIVERIVNDLRAAGVDVWYDTFSLIAGTNFATTIQEGLEESSAMLYVASRAAIQSSWVQHELDAAMYLKKAIIPVIVQSVDLPLRLRRFQFIDLREDYQSGMQRLLLALPSSVKSGSPLPPETRKSKGYVFISYAEEDTPFVVTLRKFMGERGYLYWDYQESDRDYHGQMFVELEDVIKSAKATLSILSPDWKRSKWAAKEYIFSEDVRTPVFLLKVEETGPMIITAGVPYIDFTNDQSDGFARLDHELRRKGLI